MALPTALYSLNQIRSFEAQRIAEGVSADFLMQSAALAALRTLQVHWPMAKRIVILCGPGNNAGDGYLLACFAVSAGLSVQVLAANDPTHLQAEAARAWQRCLGAGVTVEVIPAEADLNSLGVQFLAHADVIVDALLGIGLNAPLRPRMAEIVMAINAAQRPVLALDVPTGVCADTGLVSDVAVRAAVTLTFIALKKGLWLNAAPDYVGVIELADLGMPIPQIFYTPELERIDAALVKSCLKPRQRTSHKGQAGRVLIVGGGIGMAGAALLAGEACLRVGAGLVSVITAPESAAAIVAARPELMVYGSNDASELADFASQCDVLAIGPGLGQSTWGQQMFAAALATQKPLVLDADALNILAAGTYPIVRREFILTPHPGEAATLLGCDSAQIQSDRILALQKLLKRYGGIIVLKGSGTLVGRCLVSSNDLEACAAFSVPSICDRGNPGMAVPGSGDVLTGAIAGLWAQLRDPWLAARVGVWVHAAAGDVLAPHGERGVMARELGIQLSAQLSQWMNP
ncbi:MAG: NAD(P)H-hydrate dehydratase [Gammaproteobacteria bacterium]|nr:NAD(P)H-hydrate dehydratase [Gammaproteobacteria bacterium]